MEERPESAEPKLRFPQGVTEHEAMLFLGVIARLKAKRFGRVEVTVREGSVTDMEFIEKIDRNVLRSFGS